ncbi:MAG: sigma-70 family RNA polymerase sigma factor [Bacteroidaceae bacterium]|nr:sigma-70 family RNA polymerase sigma factor [Bacteroidaceae bacterium]
MTTQDYEQTATAMRPRLMEVGRAFWGDDTRADDVVQETLMRLWLMRDRLKAEEATEALLVRMAKNVCVSLWRYERIRQGAPLHEGMAIVDDETVQMETEDNLRMLRKAIDMLPRNERRLFRMRHEMDMDVGQIAATTGILPRSVSAIVSSARRKIIDKLKKGGIL